MSDNFGLKIGVEGEKQFKQAIADINQSFKVLGSEVLRSLHCSASWHTYLRHLMFHPSIVPSSVRRIGFLLHTCCPVKGFYAYALSAV